MFSMFWKSTPEKDTVGEQSNPKQNKLPQENPTRPYAPTHSEEARSAFKQEVVSDQRKLLEANLEKLKVPEDQKEKIIKRRNSLPDDYHKMGVELPSRCYWLLENIKVPDNVSWRTKARMNAFKRCQCDLVEAADNEEAAAEMKF